MFKLFGKNKNGLADLKELYWPEVSLNWPKSWWNLEKEEELRLGVQKELNAEVGPKHPLWGLKPVVFGKSNNNDDVLVHLINNHFAVVHLVWHGHIDQQPETFPSFTAFSNEADLQGFISEQCE